MTDSRSEFEGHTPGPWLVRYEEWSGGPLIEGRVPVVTMPGGCEVVVISLGASEAQIAANTRLIASAPNLLSVATDAIGKATAAREQLETALRCTRIADGDNFLLRSENARLREALDKAMRGCDARRDWPVEYELNGLPVLRDADREALAEIRTGAQAARAALAERSQPTVDDGGRGR